MMAVGRRTNKAMPYQPMDPDALLAAMRWRYAVKRFDPERKIDPSLWRTLEQSLVLTASSYGLQPWKFIVITRESTKQELLPHSYGQRQVVDCSHLLAIAVLSRLTEAHLGRYIARLQEIQNSEPAKLEKLKKIISGDLISGGRSLQAREWAVRQAYIALGNFLTSAALLGVDTCPMEGFSAKKYDATLDLGEDWTTALVCPAGYRLDDDPAGKRKKMRFAAEDLVVRVE